MFAVVLAPNLLQKLAGVSATILVGDSVVNAPVAAAARELLSAAGLVVSVCLILRPTRLSLGRRSLTSLLVLVSPWVLLTTLDLFGHGVAPGLQSLTYPLLCMAFWRSGEAVAGLRAAALCAVVAAVVSLALGVLSPALGVQSVNSDDFGVSDKPLLFGSLLSGVYFSGNNLGQFLVLLLPLILLLRGGVTRIASLALTAAAIVWSGSRSALFTMVAVLVVALVMAIFRTRTGRIRVAVTALGIAFTVSLGVPFWFANDPTAFTGRGHIWSTTLNYLADAPLVGLGSRWYGQIVGTNSDFGVTANQFVFHAHNQWLQLLTTGGVALAGLVFILLVMVAKKALRLPEPASSAALLYLLAFLLSGTLELNLGIVDRAILWPSALLPLILVAITNREDSGRPEGSSPAAARVLGAQERRDRRNADRYAPAREL